MKIKAFFKGFWKRNLNWPNLIIIVVSQILMVGAFCLHYFLKNSANEKHVVGDGLAIIGTVVLAICLIILMFKLGFMSGTIQKAKLDKEERDKRRIEKLTNVSIEEKKLLQERLNKDSQPKQKTEFNLSYLFLFIESTIIVAISIILIFV